MKKAKIVLTAIGVLAIVGGTLAFRAHNARLGSLRCTFNLNPGVVCPLITYTYTTVGPLARCTNIGQPAGTPCELVRVVANP